MIRPRAFDLERVSSRQANTADGIPTIKALRKRMGLQNDRIDAVSFALGVQAGMLEFSRVACKTTIGYMVDTSSVPAVAKKVRTDAGISDAVHQMAIGAINLALKAGRDPTGRKRFYTPGGTGAVELEPKEATDVIGDMRRKLGAAGGNVDARSLLLGFGSGVAVFSSMIGEPVVAPLFGPNRVADVSGMIGSDAGISAACVAIMDGIVRAFTRDLEDHFGNQWDA